MTRCAVTWCTTPAIVGADYLCAVHFGAWEKSEERRKADAGYYRARAEFLQRVGAEKVTTNGVDKGVKHA